MGFIAGAIAGGAFGLLRTIAQDLLESDGPDEAKIKEVQDAILARRKELIDGGMDPISAATKARRDFKQALDEASQDVDGTTAGDYLANITTDALMGGGLGWLGSSAKGAAAMGKVKSFIPGTKANASRKALATEDELAQLGTQAAKRQSLGEAEAARRMARKTSDELNMPPVPQNIASESELADLGGKAGKMRSLGLAAEGQREANRMARSLNSNPLQTVDNLELDELGKLAAKRRQAELGEEGRRLAMKTVDDLNAMSGPPGRVPLIGEPSLVPPGPSRPFDEEIQAMLDAALAKSGRVNMPKIDPTQGAMSIPSFLR